MTTGCFGQLEYTRLPAISFVDLGLVGWYLERLTDVADRRILIEGLKA